MRTTLAPDSAASSGVVNVTPPTAPALPEVTSAKRVPSVPPVSASLVNVRFPVIARSISSSAVSVPSVASRPARTLTSSLLDLSVVAFVTSRPARTAMLPPVAVTVVSETSFEALTSTSPPSVVRLVAEVMSPAAERSRIVEPPSCASSPATTASAAVVPGVPVNVTRVVVAPVAWALPVPSERLPLSATRSMSSPAVAEVIATPAPPRAAISTPAPSAPPVILPPARRPTEPVGVGAPTGTVATSTMPMSRSAESSTLPPLVAIVPEDEMSLVAPAAESRTAALALPTVMPPVEIEPPVDVMVRA